MKITKHFIDGPWAGIRQEIFYGAVPSDVCGFVEGRITGPYYHNDGIESRSETEVVYRFVVCPEPRDLNDWLRGTERLIPATH